jgi:hypothetical protein
MASEVAKFMLQRRNVDGAFYALDVAHTVATNVLATDRQAQARVEARQQQQQQQQLGGGGGGGGSEVKEKGLLPDEARDELLSALDPWANQRAALGEYRLAAGTFFTKHPPVMRGGSEPAGSAGGKPRLSRVEARKRAKAANK